MAGQIVRLFRRASSLSLADWRYLAVACKTLLMARIEHATRPTASILARLRSRLPAAPDKARTPAGQLDLPRLSWAIGAAGARVPWRSDCLLQAMAADHWLRRYGLQPEFYLGVTKDPAGPFAAHAWLRCNGSTVTGGDGEGWATLIAPPTECAPRSVLSPPAGTS